MTTGSRDFGMSPCDQPVRLTQQMRAWSTLTCTLGDIGGGCKITPILTFTCWQVFSGAWFGRPATSRIVRSRKMTLHDVQRRSSCLLINTSCKCVVERQQIALDPDLRRGLAFSGDCGVLCRLKSLYLSVCGLGHTTELFGPMMRPSA